MVKALQSHAKYLPALLLLLWSTVASCCWLFVIKMFDYTLKIYWRSLSLDHLLWAQVWTRLQAAHEIHHISTSCYCACSSLLRFATRWIVQSLSRVCPFFSLFVFGCALHSWSIINRYTAVWHCRYRLQELVCSYAPWIVCTSVLKAACNRKLVHNKEHMHECNFLLHYVALHSPRILTAAPWREASFLWTKHQIATMKQISSLRYFTSTRYTVTSDCGMWSSYIAKSSLADTVGT